MKKHFSVLFLFASIKSELLISYKVFYNLFQSVNDSLGLRK